MTKKSIYNAEYERLYDMIFDNMVIYHSFGLMSPCKKLFIVKRNANQDKKIR